MNKSSYRADIDCLRGVAVLFVIAFHYGVRHFGGGYVGVDIFFVISGYLITQIIYNEAIVGGFSFVHFYERRIRRIVPALYVLVAGVSAVSLFYLLPDEYLYFSKSAVSVVTFVSNMLFWQESGYFALSSQAKPLLHTWSLAVEEQFYLVFPALIYVLTRRDRRHEFWWFAAIALASFALDVGLVRSYPDAAFYLAPGRAWEFLLGALLAVPGVPAPKTQSHRLAAAWLGIALMAAPVFLLKGNSPAGFGLLAPCLGAALIIWANIGTEGTPPRNLFERVLVFFGAISYSLYLWHWPVLVFYRRMLGTSVEYTRLTSIDKLAMFAASVALAYLSYRVVEQPVRRRVVGSSRRSLFARAALASLALLIFGAAGVLQEGFPGRVDPKVAAIARYATYRVAESYQVGQCFLRENQTFTDIKPDCLRPVAGAKNVLLWGDSVAAHYIYGLRTLAPKFGIHFLHATASACPPIAGFTHPGRPNCRAFNDGVVSFIKTQHPDAVVMGATWNVLTREFGYDAIMGPLQKTVSAIVAQGIPVVVLGPPIEFVDNLPYILTQFAIGGLDHFEAAKFLEPEIFAIDRRMQKDFSGITGVRYVSVLGTACKPKCPAVLEGRIPLTWDKHHLTDEGSLLLAGELLPQINAALGSR